MALLCWHQCSALLASMIIYPTISPFVVDDNTHTLTYALSIFLSPFGINGKGHPQVRASFILIFFSYFHQGHYLLFYFVNHIPCSPYHHVVLASSVLMLCLLLLTSCSFLTMLFFAPPLTMLLSALSPPLLLRAKGTSPMFSYLTLKERSHSKFLSEILKCLSWLVLSKNISNLFLCLSIFILMFSSIILGT